MDNTQTHFEQLSEKVLSLLATLEQIQIENNQLKNQVKDIEARIGEDHDLQKTLDLEKEIRQLKKENKVLREREKLIKNKTERLAVKLEKISL